jgi:hypothetical protein
MPERQTVHKGDPVVMQVGATAIMLQWPSVLMHNRVLRSSEALLAKMIGRGHQLPIGETRWLAITSQRHERAA